MHLENLTTALTYTKIVDVHVNLHPEHSLNAILNVNNVSDLMGFFFTIQSWAFFIGTDVPQQLNLLVNNGSTAL